MSKDPDGLTFSTSTRRRNRFSPMFDASGNVIPAWYAATTEGGAIFETVFHDVRPSDRAPRIQPNEYSGRFLAPVVTVRALTLVDLTSTGLHAIGLSRERLIESRSNRYAWTNEIAARLRSGPPDSDGFAWVSRAHDTSQCVVLYDIPGHDTMIGAHPTELAIALGIGPGLRLLRELAVRARITLVVPSSP